MDKWSNAAMARLVELQLAEEPAGGIQVFSAAPRQPLANMKVTTKISIDLTRPNIGTRVDAMQGDGNTRYVEASLLSGGRPWVPPAGVEVAVVYRKPDGTKGLYNKLADGTPAISSDGNVVTIILAPQMLTVPGTVQASVVFNNAQLDQLTSFSFTVSVTENQYAGATVSEDYIRLEWLEDKLDEYLQKAADSGAFKGDPFTYEDFTPAQLAALQGPAGKSAFQYAVEGGYTGTEAEFSALVAYDSRKQIELVKDTMIRLHEGVPNDASGTVIALSDASDGQLQGLRIYGRTTQDGTPTPDNPVPLVSVGDGGSVEVNAIGANLLDYRKLKTTTNGGATVTNNGDGSFTISGSGALTSDFVMSYTISNDLAKKIFKPGNLYFRTNVSSTPFFGIQFSKDGAFTPIILHSKFNKYGSLDITKYLNGGYNFIFICYSGSGTEITPCTAYPMFYQIGDGTFEPYKLNTISLSTPNGLPGIPVTSGGNYTDADGQQWICDEVDFARGVYVQRIGTIDSYAGEEVSEPYLSTTGALSTGAKVLYVLATPIETPIPEDKVAAYAALHTNKPNTTIYNDAGAHMDVEYVADTKLYIDQKINEIATAIVSST